MPALPLQLALRAHPEWKDEPVVVVENDRPLAVILWANRPARRARIDRGTRFAEARVLSATLHAEIVAANTIETAVDALFERLVAFSPHVEPSLVEPGLFWLDPNGLERLHGDLARWAERVHQALVAERWVASVVVGFTRGAGYALARTRSGPRVLRDPGEERRLAARVPLARLGIAPRLRDDLALLAVHTIGDLLALPVAQLRVRYGTEAARLHDFLAGRTWTPLMPRAPEEPCIVEIEVDPPDTDQTRLLFGLKGALHDVAARLARACEAITALDLSLRLDRPGPNGERIHRERLETAAPTLDVVQLVELVHLRIAGLSLPAPVEHVQATLERVRVHPRQVALWRRLDTSTPSAASRHLPLEGGGVGRRDLEAAASRHLPLEGGGVGRRDLEAAARALARLRASFGADAVTRARPCDAHLPEVRYRYEPVHEVRLPRARAEPEPPHLHDPAAVPPLVPAAVPPLVRRVFAAPIPLPPVPVHEPDAWLGRHGALSALYGPHRIAGGWWSPRGRRERDYYFAETRRGEILWLFYDRPHRQWFLHGIVD